MDKSINKENLNKDRRNFLKIMLVGGGVLVAGKFLGPVFSRFMNGPSVETNFTSFRAVENNRTLTIYDSTGEEIFQIDKGE